MEVSFKTSYIFYPFTLPNATYETSCGMAIHLSAIEKTYQAIQEKNVGTKSQPYQFE